MTANMKTYVITLSQNFPAKHPRKGEPTDFRTKFLSARYSQEGGTLYVASDGKRKLHTIRANYELWRKRFEQIKRGEACLSVRQWSGKPYCSKQIEIARLTKEDGIGLQRLEFYNGCLQQPILSSGMTIRAEMLAQNDGLLFEDWLDWFKSYDLSKPLAIIHFTTFRYRY